MPVLLLHALEHGQQRREPAQIKSLGGLPISFLGSGAKQRDCHPHQELDRGSTTSHARVRIGFIDIPGLPSLPASFGPQLFCHEWGKPRFPLTNCLVGELPATFQKQFCQISQAQLLSEPPQDDQKDDIRRIFQEIEWRSCAFVEEVPARCATESSISESRQAGGASYP